VTPWLRLRTRCLITVFEVMEILMALTPAARSRSNWGDELEQVLREALGTIKFGSITLIIQDGKVIQVDKSEKVRLKKPEFIDGGGI